LKRKSGKMGGRYSVEDLKEAKEDARHTGMVLAKLETIHNDIIEIKNGHTQLDGRVNKIETRCSAEKVEIQNLQQEVFARADKRSAVISGAISIFALIVGIIYFFLTGSKPPGI